MHTGLSMNLQRGDIIDTPYGPGVILEIELEYPYYLLTIDVRGTTFKLKSVGIVSTGSVELD